MSTFIETVKEKLTVVLVTTVVSLVTIFSDDLVGSIRTAVNKADQRPAQEAVIASDMSIFIFCAENALEFLEKDETTKKELQFVNYPYNDAVTSLRRNEYVYLASIQRYWDKLTTEQYETFFADVRSVDRAFHAFNDEFGAVDEGTKQKVDPAKTKELAPAVAAAVAKLEQSSTILLTSLSKR